MKIAVFLPNWIGDVAMATPALRALREQYGDAHIVGVMRPYVEQVLEGTSWLNECWRYDRRSSAGALGASAVAQRMRSRDFDLAVLMPNSISSAWVAWLGRAKHRIGFGGWGRSLFLTTAIPRHTADRRPYSAVDHYLEIAEAAGASTSNRQLELSLTPCAREGACRVWKQFGWRDDDSVVALNTGSAGALAKNWSIDSFRQVAQHFVQNGRSRVLVLCGPKERDSAQAIVRELNHPHVQGMHEQDLSLGVMMGCIARSDLLISTDSGPRHLAAALGVPTVAIFGSIDQQWSHNYHAAEIGLQCRLKCGPCGKKVCPLGTNECLRKIGVEDVLRSASQLYLPGRNRLKLPA